MNLRDALRSADPARRLPADAIHDREEQLLREILAIPTTPLDEAPLARIRRRPGAVARRRPWLITAITAVALLVGTLGTLQLTHQLGAPIAHGGSPTSPALLDPLTEITDRSSVMYVSDSPKPILHVRADRTRTFALRAPAAVRSVRFYLVCTKGSTYALRTDSDESGTCRGSIGGYSDLPAVQLRSTVTVTVPAGTTYVLLAIPTPTEYSPPEVPIHLAPLDYPVNAAPAGEPLIGRARGVGASRVTGTMTRTTHSLYVVLTCRGSGTLTVSTQDGFTYGSTEESPNRDVCGSGTPTTTTYGDSEDGGMEHYGPMRYAIQPVGEVAWTVSFYDGR